MRTYSLFSTHEKASEGNKAIRSAIDAVVKQIKTTRNATNFSKEQLELLVFISIKQHIVPVLEKFSQAGARDTEPRGLIAQEIQDKLGIYVSVSNI